MTQLRLGKFLQSDKETDDLLNLDWDFKSANTKEYTHGIHVYPARMVPQIARTLIRRFSNSKDTILDPFCGSGTVLLESSISGRESIGIDINPLAILISEVKTNPLNPIDLKYELEKLNHRIDEGNSVKNRIRIPFFAKQKQIDHWFKEQAQRDLAIIREAIEYIENYDIRQFFRVTFSDTVRKVSNTRDNEYKLYRLAPEDLAKYKPDGIKTFLKYSKSAIIGMERLWKEVQNQEYSIPKVQKVDFPESTLEDGSIDLMVTSPPYGDSHTTVGYGQFSKFSLLWLGDEMAEFIPNSSDMLGGKKRIDDNIESQTLEDTLLQIRENEADLKNKREHDVKSFFADYQECIEKIFNLVKDNGFACFVVGNRTVREMRIRMDNITREIGESFGFKHYLTIFRNIPTKRQPSTQKLYVDPKWTEINGKRKPIKIENIIKESIVIMNK